MKLLLSLIGVENLVNKMKKLHTLDKYIIFCFVVLLLYTIVHIVVFLVTNLEMAVIAKLFYAAFGGEVLCCALLKRLKLNNEHKKQMKDIELIDIEKEVEDGTVG